MASKQVDSQIAPVFCLWCSEKIPDSRRGTGHPPKTCSDACRKARAADREKRRYQRVKDSDSWKQVRGSYLARLRALVAEDPDFAKIFRAHSAERVRKWNEKLRRTDPSRHAAMKAAKRAERAEWRKRLVSDPAAWDQYKAEARAWYHRQRSRCAAEAD